MITLNNSQASNLINIRQASQFLSVSVSTLYGWIWQRRIPYIKVGRAVRFDIQDLEKFVNSSRYAAR
jgi:excisionase family DNA binding protein